MNSQQLQILALIHASHARVLGMEAANQQRIVCGESIMYSEDHFREEAQQLEILSVQALNS
jgi:hypothetical protein